MTHPQPGARALLAVRISNLTEVTTSPDSQLARCRAEADRLGASVVGVAEDLDISAAKVTPWDRPQLGAWLRQPEKYDMIICRDLFRIIRSMSDFTQVYDWSRKHDIRIITLDPYVDYYTHVGKIVGYNLAWVGEMEVQADSERVTGALAYMRSVARWGKGRVPFGYRMCPHSHGAGYGLEPDPETAPVILEAAGRFLNGEAILSICRDFNQRGVLAPEAYLRQKAGRAPDPSRRLMWHPRTLGLILRSPSMRNLVTHRGRQVRGEDGLPLRYGPPLMNDDEHRALVAEMDKRAKPRERKRGGAAPLLGVAFCAGCESKLYLNRTHAKPVYRCASRYRGLSDCDGCSVDQDAAEKFAEDQFLRAVGRLQMTIYEEDRGEDHSAEIADLQEALTELERDRYEGGLFRGEEGRQRYRQQYLKIETRLKEVRSLPSRPPGVREIETGLTYSHEWSVSTIEQRRQTLISRGARVLVRGFAKDGPAESRLEFELPGYRIDDLIALGHDDPLLGE